MNADAIKSKGWLVVAAGLGVNLCLGVLYSWSVIGKYISAPAVDPVTKVANTTTWGLTAAQAALPYSVALGVFAIMMVFAGRAQDKLGPRLVSTIGGVLLGLGLIISSFATKDTFYIMIIGFGIFGGTGIALGYASATPGAVKWFPPQKKGLITGLVVAGFGLASVYIAPLTQALLNAYKVNQTFLILGILFLFVTVLLSQFMVNPPKGYVPAGTAPATAATPGTVKKKVEYEWHEMIKKPQFFMMWLMYAFVSFAGLMIIGHMAKIAKVQVVTELGFLLTAVLAVGNASGRIVAGQVSDKIGRQWTMMIFFLSQAVFMGILYFTGSGMVWLLVAAAFGIGFNYGANLTLFPATTGDYFGVKNMGVNYGLVFTAWGVGGVFGSQVAGSIFDATGSYGNAYAIAAGLCILAAVMTLALKPPKHADLAPGEE